MRPYCSTTTSQYLNPSKSRPDTLLQHLTSHLVSSNTSPSSKPKTSPAPATTTYHIVSAPPAPLLKRRSSQTPSIAGTRSLKSQPSANYRAPPTPLSGKQSTCSSLKHKATVCQPYVCISSFSHQLHPPAVATSHSSYPTELDPHVTSAARG